MIDMRVTHDNCLKIGTQTRRNLENVFEMLFVNVYKEILIIPSIPVY